MVSPDQSPPEHPPLGGEAPDGLYGFEDETGTPVIGGEGIIPILERIDEHQYKFIGTGFFITDFGVFATARHVLMPAHERGHRIFTWEIIPPDQWYIRPVLQLKYHAIADVAVGVSCQAIHQETGEHMVNARVRLTTRVQAIGDVVSTYAYPNTIILNSEQGQTLSFNPNFYEGRIAEYLPNGRDGVLLPGPCYRTSISIHHGASGGPVAGPAGRVFAENSTGFDGTGDSYVSRIEEVLSLSILIDGDHGEEEITVQQLAERSYVTIDS
jgi:Trypsin-like peptidase domain